MGATFDSCIHYIDDIPSQNNSQYVNYLHLIYQNLLEVKDTLKSPSYIDLHIEIYNRQGKTLYDKCDDFILPIVSFPFINSITSVWSLYFTTHTCAQLSEFLEIATNSWSKRCSYKASFLLSRCHRYKYDTVVTTDWLTVTKYPDPKWKWIFSLLHRFFPSITDNAFTGLDFRTPEFTPAVSSLGKCSHLNPLL